MTCTFLRHLSPLEIFALDRDDSSLLLKREPLRGRSVVRDIAEPGCGAERTVIDRGHFNFPGGLNYPGRTMKLLLSRPAYFRPLCLGLCDMY